MHRRLVAVVLCAAPATAQADVISAAYSSSTQYIYEINHMPDFDQKRLGGSGIIGLPGIGCMYCVPTSTVNMLAYAANHGFPQVAPGPANWQAQANYNAAGGYIALVGVWMNTDADDGTNGSGWLNGTHLALGGNPLFAITKYTANGNWSPTQASMALTAMNGSLVSFAFGRYDVVGDAGDQVLVGTRESGHVVTLVKAQRSGAASSFEVRDPGDSDDWLTQSMFQNTVYTTRNHTIINLSAPYARQMTSINYPSDDGLIRLMDSYLAITPMFGFEFQNQQINLTFPFGSFGSEPEVNFELASEIIDALVGPDYNNFFILSPDGLDQLNRITGELGPVVDIPGARCMIFGRMRELYVVTEDMVHCYDLDAEPDEMLTATADLLGPVDAMTYDDMFDEVVMANLTDREILRYRRGLPAGAPPVVYPIDEIVPDGDSASIAINPVDQKVWLVTGDGTMAYCLEIIDGDPIWRCFDLDGCDAPKSIDFDNAGRMLVSCGDRVHLYKLEGETWERQKGEGFDGIAATGPFRTIRDRTNFDPATMDGPEWFNIEPDDLIDTETVPDCVGDFNGDGTVDVGDLLELLGAWGTAHPYADIAPNGGDLTVDVQDMLALIAAWGACR